MIQSLAMRPSVSVVTLAELYAGIRNESEHQRIEGLSAALDVRHVDFDIRGLLAATAFNIVEATASAFPMP